MFFGLWVALSHAAAVDFNAQVRPILADKCYTCHGPDSGKKLPLRLDSEAGASGAIVASHPEQSKLIQRITAEKPAMRMPPVYSGLKLTDNEIATLRQWIAEGAVWQKHWSLISPKRPELPAVSDQRWPRNAIDSFVMARLDHEGLKPSPEAPKETLIRRVTRHLVPVGEGLAEPRTMLGG